LVSLNVDDMGFINNCFTPYKLYIYKNATSVFMNHKKKFL